jgi:methionyl-tRNA synthetase
MARFYVTTPIYYVNDVPHLGTAYTTIVADALRRYHLLRGNDARMLTGTDEHGLKVERVAAEHGVTPKEWADSTSARFRAAWPKLDVEPSDFLRTTEPRHMAFVQELWKTIERNGDLYEGDYEDWYCVGCESFKTEKELSPGNLCPVHLKAVERLKEKTFFFRLSKYQKILLELYAKKTDFIAPKERRNEVISFVEGGLHDLSVSRTSFKWGIPVPGNAAHVMFVWFDALANYMSALKHGPHGEDLMAYWPKTGHDTRAVHVVGKDIIRFHAVYWPAFLLAAGFSENELPSQVFAHGFLTIDGMKMSKTLRNGVDPVRLASEVGTDTLRYHLLRAVAFGQDGDFDHAALIERYNADLGKNLGNLLNRTLGLCAKYTSSKVGPGYAPSPLEEELLAAVSAHVSDVTSEWNQIAPHRALEATWAIASAANQYVDRAAPWSAVKDPDKERGQARVETILTTLLSLLSGLSVLIWPAMPTKSDEMRKQLGLLPISPKEGVDLFANLFARRAPGESFSVGAPLFPVIDKDAEQSLLGRLVPLPLESTTSPSAVEPTAGSVAPSPLDTAKKSALGTRALIAYDQFDAVDLRAGIIVSAERVPKKDKLLRLKVDIGEESLRSIIAGLAKTFAPEVLIGKRVVVVANLAPRDFGGGNVSFGMLLASGPSEKLSLATVPEDVAPGARLK